MVTRRVLTVPVVAILASGLLLRPVAAQEKDLQSDLRKLVEEGGKAILGEIEKVISARAEKVLAEIIKKIDEQSAARIAKLEEAVKSRDQKIAELEAKVKELAAGKPPQGGEKPQAGALLGVGYNDVPADLRAKLKLEGGALVTRVLEGSPAAQAGVQSGDVLVNLNGNPVHPGNLESVLAGFKPEQEINLTYIHDGASVTKSAKLVDRQKFVAGAGKEAPPATKREPVELGVTVVEREGAVFVETVEEGFTGAVAGLAKDDKITHLNGKEVKNIDQIIEEKKKILEGDKFTVTFLHGKDTTITANVLAGRGKGTAKLVTSDAKQPSKPAEKKAGLLGIFVIPEAGGIVIESVVPDGAAAAFGVQKGDILKKFNGQDLAQVDQLKTLLSKLYAGDKVTLVVQRGDQSVEIKEIALAAEGEKVAPVVAAQAPPKDAPAPPAAAKKPGIMRIVARETDDHQVLVKSVTAGGPGEKAGLKPEDQILRANDKEIRTFDDLEKALKGLGAGDTVTLRIKRGSEEKEFQVTLAEAPA